MNCGGYIKSLVFVFSCCWEFNCSCNVKIGWFHRYIDMKWVKNELWRYVKSLVFAISKIKVGYDVNMYLYHIENILFEINNLIFNIIVIICSDKFLNEWFRYL